MFNSGGHALPKPQLGKGGDARLLLHIPNLTSKSTLTLGKQGKPTGFPTGELCQDDTLINRIISTPGSVSPNRALKSSRNSLQVGAA